MGGSALAPRAETAEFSLDSDLRNELSLSPSFLARGMRRILNSIRPGRKIKCVGVCIELGIVPEC